MKWILRILLGLVGLLVLAVVVLFVLSKRPDAGKGDVTIDIARPPDVVWQWVSEEREARPLGSVWLEERSSTTQRPRRASAISKGQR